MYNYEPLVNIIDVYHNDNSKGYLGVAEPRNVYYRLDPKNTFNNNGMPDIKDYPIHYTGFTHVPMGDWDWADKGHIAQNSITIENLGHAVDKLEQYVTDTSPDSYWKVYLTNGGVRAWDIGKRQRPIEWKSSGRFEQLNIDPNYARLSGTTKRLPTVPEGLAYPSFWTRVSGKPQRGSDDFVAMYLGDITGNNANINADSLRQISLYHDKPIQEWLLREGLDNKSVALELASQHLETVPKKWAMPIIQRLGL